jgi:hypothetical protein
MAKKEKAEAQKERDAVQLKRLHVLTDVIFGVLIIRVFSLLPHFVSPTTGDFNFVVIAHAGSKEKIRVNPLLPHQKQITGLKHLLNMNYNL